MYYKKFIFLNLLIKNTCYKREVRKVLFAFYMGKHSEPKEPLSEKLKNPRLFLVLMLFCGIIIVIGVIVALHNSTKDNVAKSKEPAVNSSATFNYILERGTYLNLVDYQNLKDDKKIDAYETKKIEDTNIAIDLYKNDTSFLAVPYDSESDTIEKPSIFGDEDEMKSALEKYIEKVKLNTMYPTVSYIQKHINEQLPLTQYVNERDSLNTQYKGDVVNTPYELDFTTADFIKTQTNYVAILRNADHIQKIYETETIEEARKEALDYNDKLVKKDYDAQLKTEKAKKEAEKVKAEQDKLKQEQEERARLEAQAQQEAKQQNSTSNATISNSSSANIDDDYSGEIANFIRNNRIYKLDFANVATQLIADSYFTSSEERLKAASDYATYMYQSDYQGVDPAQFDVFLKNIKNDESTITATDDTNNTLALLMMAKFQQKVQPENSAEYRYAKGYYDIKRVVYTGAYSASDEAVGSAIKELKEIGASVN